MLTVLSTKLYILTLIYPFQTMPDIVNKDVSEPNEHEKDEDEEEESEEQLERDKKHNSGAADLEKVKMWKEKKYHPHHFCR